MPNPPETYTGAWFTLRYDQCKSRITGFGLGYTLAAVFDTAGTILLTANYPYFAAIASDVVAQAELRYMYREISAETPDQWTYWSKVKWTEIIRKYEDVLAMEAGLTITSADVTSQTITHGHTIDTELQDTPYGQLSGSSDYTSEQSLQTHGGSDTIKTRDELDSEILSRFRSRWQPTIESIVDELGELFIQIIGGNFVL